MSRNKMIKFVHETTGLSYGECRRRLKECNWDVWKASGMETVADKILDVLPDFSEAIAIFINAVADSITSIINSIDWQALSEAVIEAQRNLEEIKDEDRVLLPDGQDPDSDSSGEGDRF